MKKNRIPRPCFKWAGGKSQLLDQLLKVLPSQGFNRYHEPFMGGGALFFELLRSGKLDDKKSYLTDINADLIETYRALQSNARKVIRILKTHYYDKEYYYKIRELDLKQLSSDECAARMLYLNRCGFNGLYRVNKKGKFNVPFGRYTNPVICDENNLLAVSDALKNAKLQCRSFSIILSQVKKWDLVYFDPPYVPVSQTANFVSYTKDGFSESDQLQLVEIVKILTKRGVYVILSNSDTPWIRKHYEDFHIISVQARRSINSNAKRRGPVGEVLILNYSVDNSKNENQ